MIVGVIVVIIFMIGLEYFSTSSCADLGWDDIISGSSTCIIYAKGGGFLCECNFKIYLQYGTSNDDCLWCVPVLVGTSTALIELIKEISCLLLSCPDVKILKKISKILGSHSSPASFFPEDKEWCSCCLPPAAAGRWILLLHVYNNTVGLSTFT